MARRGTDTRNPRTKQLRKDREDAISEERILTPGGRHHGVEDTIEGESEGQSRSTPHEGAAQSSLRGSTKRKC